MKSGRDLICILVVTCMLLALCPAVSAGSSSLQAPTDAELAAQYAPMLYFKNGEKLYPVSVEYFIQNSNLNRSAGGTPTLVDAAPTVQKLAAYAGGSYSEYYLDNRLGSINDDRIIKAYQQNEETLGYTVYYHITMDGTTTVIQYWFFYVFNPGTFNNHEGDWEMVQITLDSNYQPVRAMYSQHESGMIADWSQVERSGDHIKVFVALGSHANYFRSYQGKTGIAQDTVGDDGKRLSSDDYALVDMGEYSSPNLSPNTAWIKFGGHWGDYGSTTAQFRGERGPLGPVFRQSGEIWNSPTAWGAGLMALNENLLLLDQLYYNLIWIIIGFLLLAVLLMVVRIIRRKKKGESLHPICAMLEIKGTDRRSMANILAIIAVAIAIIGAFLPYYSASANIPSGQFETQDWFDVLKFSGWDGLLVNGVDDQGVPYQMAAIPIQFGLFIFLSMATLVIYSIAARRKKMPGRYFGRGITLIVSLILVLVVVGSISALEPMFHSIDGAEGGTAVIQEIAKNPMGGSKTITVAEYGTVEMKWGLGIGAILMLIAGILFLVAGLLYRGVRLEETAPMAEAPKGQ